MSILDVLLRRLPMVNRDAAETAGWRMAIEPMLTLLQAIAQTMEDIPPSNAIVHPLDRPNLRIEWDQFDQLRAIHWEHHPEGTITLSWGMEHVIAITTPQGIHARMNLDTPPPYPQANEWTPLRHVPPAMQAILDALRNGTPLDPRQSWDDAIVASLQQSDIDPNRVRHWTSTWGSPQLRAKMSAVDGLASDPQDWLNLARTAWCPHASALNLPEMTPGLLLS